MRDSCGTGWQSEKWKWLVQPRQAKGEWASKAHFALVHLTFDLEGLATATRQVRHLRVKRTNVAHRLPRGKRATWNGNQSLPKTTKFAKTAFLKAVFANNITLRSS
ncbi:hypothetical protein QUF49_07665 [Fictibacillus sp. b24]|uniref:hypothetical protein n=1 Tax=Fictibacillus sp. b24 TaxID=3055863 RepID=UPI0025A00BD0|nr:hypothetical protein [Fictibacillus sp. b24]MDM5315871.1 hypothetical protein [Fictibacillus sp. b24]